VKRFDAHCHLFNLWYLISELVAIGWDATLGGGYPRRLPDKVVLKGPMRGADFKKLLDELLSFLRQLVEIGFTLFNDYQGNYGVLKHEYLAAFPDQDDLLVVPLMMDIYYMFVGYRSGAKSLAASQPVDPQRAFDEWYGKVKDIVHEGMDRSKKTLFASSGATQAPAAARDQIDARFETLLSELKSGSEPMLLRATGGAPMPNTVMTPGFEKEIKDSIKFWKDMMTGPAGAKRSRATPFLAVDPRRDGIMDLVKSRGAFGWEGPLVSHEGPFYGIKLYPRLGYKPEELTSLGLYDWCAQNDFPITFHCNTGGFPPLFKKWPWKDYSDPELWRDILTRYKGVNGGLRLNCAHFGEGDANWRKTIIAYASNAGGLYGTKVYTDIACFTGMDQMRNALRDYQGAPGMKGKLQLGSDYDVMLLAGFTDLKTYFEQFNDAFGPAGLIPEVAEKAPRSFLAGSNIAD
jgi:hypothetical protein